MVGIRVSLVVSFIITMVAAAHAQDETQYSRKRYDLIVERSPFGADPEILAEAQKDAKEAAESAAAAKKLEQDMRLCFLLESEGGEIKAGFQNKKAKKGDPKSILLMVGESFNGIKLLDIDFPNSSAKLLYQGKEISFSLSKSAVPAKKKPTAAVTKPKPPTRRFGSGFRRRQQPKPAPKKPAEPQLSPAEQARQREEVRENLRQYQMEVIRAGMPPLPIPLTPEMDDQLVSEGVLPPVEE